MYAINGFAIFFDSIFDDYTLVDPFTNSTLVLPTQPTVYTTLTNLNSSSSNSTGGGDIGIWDAVNYGWNTTVFVFNMLTGGFIFQSIAAFVPAAGDTLLVFGVIQGTVAFFLILTILHFVRGIL